MKKQFLLSTFMSAIRERECLEVIDDPHFGFFRVAGAVTFTKVADPFANLPRHLMAVQKAKRLNVDGLQFGELSLVGYSCGRYLQQKKLRRDGIRALLAFVKGVRKIGYNGFIVVGVPLVIGAGLYNCAVSIGNGKILGVSVKRHPPNYEEHLELKVFAYGDTLTQDWVRIGDQKVPVGTLMIYDCENLNNVRIGIGICEDNWTLLASANILAANGANILFDLSGSDELIGKEKFRLEQQVVGLSSRNIAACIYVSQGPGESSSHVVFSGACGIADNGTLLAETKPLAWVDTITDPKKLGESMIVADVDLDHLEYDRLRTNSHIVASRELASKFPARIIPFKMKRSKKPRQLLRKIDAHPYVPSTPEAFDQVCRKLNKIQLAANITRLLHSRSKELWLALSGGSDSMNQCHKLVQVCDALGFPRSAINIVTMPGFGTTSDSYNIAVETARALGCTLHINDIKPIAFAFMKAIGHKPFGIEIENMVLDTFIEKLKLLPEKVADVIFENVQAHIRTVVPTRRGFTFGTGDMSELMIGWCTFLADQVGGHYNCQSSVPKTLVKQQLKWVAENDADMKIRDLFQRAYNLIVSPELLPTGPNGELRQKTDDVNGPEEVRDFYMRYFRRYGDTPAKILYLALNAVGWKYQYTQQELVGWWQPFAFRSITQRFKSSLSVDGAQSGSDSLMAVGGNWVVPGDASPALWALPEGFDVTPFLVKDEAKAKSEKPAAKKAKKAKKRSGKSA